MQLTKVCKSLRLIEIEELKTDLRTFAAFNNWKLSFRDIFWIFSKSFKNFTLDLPVTTLYFWLVQIKHVGILETIEAFYVVRSAYKVARLSNSIENIINKKSYELARAFRDLWSLVMFWKFSNCTRLRLLQFCELLKTSLVPINHEMHTCSYDFLYLIDGRIIFTGNRSFSRA